MKIKVGSDILQIQKFQVAFKKYPQKFKRDIFCESELQNPPISHLAGLFAAKEAVIKALDLKPGSWKQIEIKNTKTGKPILNLDKTIPQKKIESCDLSIAHHGDYVMAVVAILFND